MPRSARASTSVILAGKHPKSRFKCFAENNVIKLSFDKTTWTGLLPRTLLFLRFRFKYLPIETGHHLKNCVIIQKYDFLAAVHWHNDEVKVKLRTHCIVLAWCQSQFWCYDQLIWIFFSLLQLSTLKVELASQGGGGKLFNPQASVVKQLQEEILRLRRQLSSGRYKRQSLRCIWKSFWYA